MVLTEPNVSTAGNLRIKAFWRTIRWVPSANVTVITAGNPSGTTATAILKETSKSSRKFLKPSPWRHRQSADNDDRHQNQRTSNQDVAQLSHPLL